MDLEVDLKLFFFLKSLLQPRIISKERKVPFVIGRKGNEMQ